MGKDNGDCPSGMGRSDDACHSPLPLGLEPGMCAGGTFIILFLSSHGHAYQPLR